MYLNSFFLVTQLVIIVGVKNGLVQGLEIGGNPVPNQCTSTCAPASALYDTCSTLTDPQAIAACVCTTEADTEIQQCINCVIPIEPSAASNLEQLREQFNLACSGLPPLTFPSTSNSTVTSPTATSTTTPSTVTSSTVTSHSTTSPTPAVSGSSSSASATPTTTSGAELSVKSQLGSMGIAIGISLLLRIL